jgi:hypothetical protein
MANWRQRGAKSHRPNHRCRCSHHIIHAVSAQAESRQAATLEVKVARGSIHRSHVCNSRSLEPVTTPRLSASLTAASPSGFVVAVQHDWTVTWKLCPPSAPSVSSLECTDLTHPNARLPHLPGVLCELRRHDQIRLIRLRITRMMCDQQVSTPRLKAMNPMSVAFR